MSTTEQQLREAYELGADAARAAASWATDGNSDPDMVRKLLRGLDDGDPAVWDALPAQPDLSGEWADDPTPLSIACDVLGGGPIAPEEIIELCEQWELGAQETYETAVEKQLRTFLGERNLAEDDNDEEVA